MLAVLDRFHRHARAELDFAGALDDDVDVFRSAQEQRVLGHRAPLGRDRALEAYDRVDVHHAIHAPVHVSPDGLAERPVGDSCEPHAAHRRQDLQRDPTAHISGAHQPDVDRSPFALAPLKCRIHDDHDAPRPAAARTALAA